VKIDISQRDDAIHAAIQGDLSSGAYADAFTGIRKVFSEQPRDVVLDLGGVEHISSFALAGVLRLQQFVRSQQRTFRMANPSDTVRHILSKTGMDKHFQELGPSEETPAILTSDAAQPAPAATPVCAAIPEEPRPGRERLASQIRALEELLTEHQAVTDERDTLAKTAERDALARRALDADLQASRQRVQALEQERDALSGLRTQLETAQKELTEAKASVDTLARDCRKAQEAQVLIETMLTEARTREEQLSGQTKSLTRCLTEIQEKIQRQMAHPELGSAGDEDGLQLPVFARDEADRVKKPTRPRL
jgi:anti-anti-sigma factor